MGGLAPVVWRLHMLAWGAGWDLAPDYRSRPLLIGYVLALVLVEALASLAVLGLVRPWGEVWPDWVPGMGGRRIPPAFVVTVASLGALAVSLIVAAALYNIITMTVRGQSNPILQVHGWHRWFMLAHYVPWVLWPIGLWVAIVGYARRWFVREV